MSQQQQRLLGHGAEARIIQVDFGSRKAICKERFKKRYRLAQLDEKLTLRRILQEARTLVRCRTAGVDTPILYNVDVHNCLIYMECIEGVTVRDYLREQSCTDKAWLAEKIGNALARMHSLDIIHGDLTTSNLMIRDSNRSVVLIDFGLSFVSTLIEDKAVDLYVLERAFQSTHPNSSDLFGDILRFYKDSTEAKDGPAIVKRLEEVRKRGRKRTMIG